MQLGIFLFFHFAHITFHDQLPVYKVTYDFLLAIFAFSKSFTREYRYTTSPSRRYEDAPQDLV